MLGCHGHLGVDEALGWWLILLVGWFPSCLGPGWRWAPVGCGSTIAFFFLAARGLASFSVPLGFGLLSLSCVWAAIGPRPREGCPGTRVLGVGQ